MDEFRQDAVCILLLSGLTRKQLADDLGVGMSTLNKWINQHRDTDVVSQEDISLAQENDRLWREIRILKEERDILKKSHPVLCGPRAMRFGLLKNTLPAYRSSDCARLLAPALVDCGPFEVALPAAGSGLIWSHWCTSKNNRVSAWAVMADLGSPNNSRRLA